MFARIMMDHPITPPPELVKRLQDLGNLDAIRFAYQAGADWELGTSEEWLKTMAMTRCWNTVAELASELRAARRPKPKSQSEEALEALDEMNAPLGSATANRFGIIRAALERLRELENQ